MEDQRRLIADISLRGRTVQSMEEAFQVLHQCSRDEVYPLAMQIQAELMTSIESSEDNLYRLHEFVNKGEFWRGHELDEDSFRYNWRAARDAIANREKRMEYIDSIREKSIKAWGKSNAKAFFLRIKTRAMAENVSKLLSANLNYASIRLMINNEIVNRLSTKSRGIRRDKAVMQGDISKAFSNRCLKPLSTEELQALGLEIDEDGYCCPAGSGRALVHEFEYGDINDLTDSYNNGPHHRSDEIPREFSPDPMSKSNMASKKSKKRKRKELAQCGCLLSYHTIHRIFSSSRLDPNGQRALLKFGGKIMKRSDKIDTNSICSTHSLQLCNKLYMAEIITHRERAERLDTLYNGLDSWEETCTRYSNWFRRPSSSSETPTGATMFRFQKKNIRPMVEDWDNLKHLTFQNLYQRCFDKDQQSVLGDMDNQMQMNGSIVISGLFNWLKHDFDGKHPGGILRLALLEFAMYDWHFHSDKDHPRLGWARNMWYGLIQQLVRQDIVYWMWHVYFRPDHEWRLISVPQCSQSSYPGEQTQVWQPDTKASICALLDHGRGKNVLHGSVLFDDEDEENCEEVLLGMNRHIGSWWKNVLYRGLPRNGCQQEIVPKLWTATDKEKFGIDWVKQVCQATDVRFTLPDVPSKPTATPMTSQRHSVSAYFVGIDDDYSGLLVEMFEVTTWDDISRAHRDFLPGDATSIGQQPNPRHIIKTQPPPFPGIVRLCGLGAISDALVCRERWTSTETIQMVNLLFGPDDNMAREHIRNWREKAFEKYVAAFDRMVETEKSTYGENSFFNRIEAGLSTQPAFVYRAS